MKEKKKNEKFRNILSRIEIDATQIQNQFFNF